MGVLEFGGEEDFALEPLRVDAGAHLRRQNLDDHLAAEPGFLGEEDVAHTPAAELALDAVGVAYYALEAGLEVYGEAPSAGEGDRKATTPPRWGPVGPLF